MTRFWCSWEQPTDDYRCLHWPPDERILGYWCSGEAEEAYILCAVVQAKDENDARAAVEKEWPEFCVEEWRFLNPTSNDFVPGDRFPRSDWMIERFTKDKPVGD